MAPGTWQPGSDLVDFIERAKVEYMRQTGRPPEAVYLTPEHLAAIVEFLEQSGMLKPCIKLRTKANPTILGMRIVVVRNPEVGP